MPPDARALADMILRQTILLDEAVQRLDGFKDSSRQLIELRDLEDEGDRLFRDGVGALFRSGADPLMVIRWKDIYEGLEEAVDACENAADVLEAILVKNRWRHAVEGDILLVVVVVVALGFDFTNGFHDTANAVATSISTRALPPRLAVAVASVANLVGAFVTTAVATTVGSGVLDTELVTTQDRARRRCSARSPGTSPRGGSGCRRARRTR